MVLHPKSNFSKDTLFKASHKLDTLLIMLSHLYTLPKTGYLELQGCNSNLILVQCILTFAGIPPTKTLLGINVPYLGTDDKGLGVIDSGDVSPDDVVW